MTERQAPEVEVANDLARRAVPVGAVLVVLSAIVWGVDGALSCLVGLAIVVANFLASAMLISAGARRGQTALLVAVMGGYIGRLALVVLAIVAVKDASWVERAPFYGTILLTHVGLLVWETRAVSASLAFPGLKPRLVPSKEAPTP